LLLIAVVGCTRSPATLEVGPLADDEWITMDPSIPAYLLHRSRDAHPRAERQAAPPLPVIRVLRERLEDVAVDTFSLQTGRASVSLIRLDGGSFYAPLLGQPHLRRSPADDQRYVFEHLDAIWAFETPDIMRQLTHDNGLDSLRALQREGEVILYWSVDPVWSGDGKFIAFLTNREAVRGGRRGQSIWIIDANTGVQRPLYDPPDVSAHVEAAFGAEFVFISNRDPGVFSIHPRNRRVTKLGNGYVLAGHPAGAALLLNENGALVFLRSETRDTLAAPPGGHVWSTRATIAPSGDKVALFSTDQRGEYVLHVLRPGTPALPGYRLPAPPSSGPAWTDDHSIIFSVQNAVMQRTYRAVLR
jgi:hypothetical protein